MRTRYATEIDLSRVYQLCWAGYEDLKEIAPETVEPDLLWQWIKRAHKQAPCVLLEKDNEIIGFWGLCTLKAAWSHDAVLADYMFYIEPQHRSIKATKQLVKAVKHVADTYEMPLRLNYLFKGKLSLHARIFNMMGFKAHGLIGFYKG